MQQANAKPLFGDDRLNFSCSESEILFDDEVYVPVNFFPDEVYEMFEAWERLQNKERDDLMDDSDSMEASSFSVSGTCQEAHGLMEISCEASPPKRYRRRFWASVTRRLVERADKQINQ